MSEASRPANVPTDSLSHRNRSSLISRDLDDIYLMLDHLSGRADKSVSALTIDVEGDAVGSSPEGKAPAQTAPATVKRNLIQSVCNIEGWPPSNQTQYNADAATILFKARDRLNEVAWPASGMTIAYTIMVTDLTNASERQPSGIFAWLRRGVAQDQQVAGQSNSGALSRETEIREKNAERTDLARSAYPHLEQPARILRKWIVVYICMLVAVLVCTAVLSWNVAAGKLIIERLNEAKLRETVEAARLVGAGGQFGPVLQTAGASSDDVPDAGYVFDTLCTRSGSAVPGPDPNPPAQSLAQKEVEALRRNSLCGKGLAILEQRFASDASLRQWFDPWKRVTSWGRGLDPEVVAEPGKPLDNRTRIANAAAMEQQAGDASSVLATYVLPILYGLLGATTAVIRNLNGKMRDSTLAPRDLRVSQVQLALGILVGACIGLFLSPTGAPDAHLPNVTLAGNGVALSASALSFIAGFGVEAVFKWLEVIISIAFAAGGAAVGQQAPPPPQAGRQP